MSDADAIKQLLDDLTENERVLLQKVLEAERSKLYQYKPRGMAEDLAHIVREVISK